MEKRYYYKVIIGDNIYFKSFTESNEMANIHSSLNKFFDCGVDYDEISKSEYQEAIGEVDEVVEELVVLTGYEIFKRRMFQAKTNWSKMNEKQKIHWSSKQGVVDYKNITDEQIFLVSYPKQFLLK